LSRRIRGSTPSAVTHVGIKEGETRGGPVAIHLTSVRGESERSVRARGTTHLKIPFFQRRYGALVRPTVKLFARIHLGLLRASRGGVGRRLFGSRTILLTTVGRRSGRAWTTPLAYMRHGDNLVVAASCAGSDRLPDWWLNLQRQPKAVIEMAGVKRVVHAHQAESQMLSRLTPDFEDRYPRMHFYRRMSRREIPLIVLRPIHELGTEARPPESVVSTSQWGMVRAPVGGRFDHSAPRPSRSRHRQWQGRCQA
jgi:deazaflavin-dependent oxidoreductase (nitroreductase family)